MRDSRRGVAAALVVLALLVGPPVAFAEGVVDDAAAQKATVDHLLTVILLCQAWMADNEVFPGPTEDWVEVSTLAEEFVPIYIQELSGEDGWGHPMLYWSDGKEHFVIVSPGRDGEVERDWRESAAQTDAEIRVTNDPEIAPPPEWLSGRAEMPTASE